MKTYNIGDRVVVKNYGSNEIGIITEINRSKKKISGYLIRAEKGSEYAYVGTDNNDSSQTIDSTYTKLINKKGLETNLTVESLGNFKS
jgi:hypothetical protein